MDQLRQRTSYAGCGDLADILTGNHYDGRRMWRWQDRAETIIGRMQDMQAAILQDFDDGNRVAGMRKARQLGTMIRVGVTQNAYLQAKMRRDPDSESAQAARRIVDNYRRFEDTITTYAQNNPWIPKHTVDDTAPAQESTIDTAMQYGLVSQRPERVLITPPVEEQNIVPTHEQPPAPIDVYHGGGGGGDEPPATEERPGWWKRNWKKVAAGAAGLAALAGILAYRGCDREHSGTPPQTIANAASDNDTVGTAAQAPGMRPSGLTIDSYVTPISNTLTDTLIRDVSFQWNTQLAQRPHAETIITDGNITPISREYAPPDMRLLDESTIGLTITHETDRLRSEHGFGISDHYTEAAQAAQSRYRSNIAGALESRDIDADAKNIDAVDAAVRRNLGGITQQQFSDMLTLAERLRMREDNRQAAVRALHHSLVNEQ